MTDNKLVITGLCIALFLSFVTISAQSKTITAQLIPGTEPNGSVNNEAATDVKPRQTYTGQSLKIFSVWNFNAEQLWKPIDNYTSNGYDLKAVVPFNERYMIVLEKDNILMP